MNVGDYVVGAAMVGPKRFAPEFAKHHACTTRMVRLDHDDESQSNVLSCIVTWQHAASDSYKFRGPPEALRNNSDVIWVDLARSCHRQL